MMRLLAVLLRSILIPSKSKDMEKRTREYTRKTSGGVSINGYYSPPRISSKVLTEERRVTVDYHKKVLRESGPLKGYLPPSPFFMLWTDKNSVPRVTCKQGKFQVNDYVIDYHTALPILGSLLTIPAAPRQEDDSFYATKLLAETAPDRTEISVPVFIAELIEITSMFRIVGSTPLSIFGSAYLLEKFGWQTFLTDLGRFRNVTKTIESRIREYNSLVQSGGLRRKINLDRFSWKDVTSNKIIHSFRGIVKADIEDTFSKKVWGSLRWVPANDVLIPTEPLEVFNEAVSQVLDLEAPDFETVWELIPFSWLVDYFVNVGDAMQAAQSQEKYTPLDVCLMESLDVRRDYKVFYTDSKVRSYSGGYIRQVCHSRKLLSPSENFESLLSFSWLTANEKTTIFALLASLSDLIAKRR